MPLQLAEESPWRKAPSAWLAVTRSRADVQTFIRCQRAAIAIIAGAAFFRAT